MTVFKATQQVSLSATSFASIFGFLQHNPVIEIANGNELKLENSAHTIELDFRSVPGHAFTYNGHSPTGGTVASLQINLGGPPATIAYKFSGMAVSVATVASDVNHGHYGAILSLFLPGHDTITGSPFADHLVDIGGHDRITGGAGNDTMSGGNGYDTFVFRAGFGNDVINHFVAGSVANHDTIELHSILGLHSFAQVKAHETIVSGHVVISDTSGDSIALTNVHTKAALTAADFHIFT
jgi:Ca2+-binding RTX toxin-like protein